MQAYTRISEELLPTPAKSHYTFNMRDLSKLFQGMLMISPANCKEKDTMQRLWVHESMRVFHDRLIDNEDKTYFKTMLVELISQKFGQAASYDDLFVDRYARPRSARELRQSNAAEVSEQPCGPTQRAGTN